MPATSFAGMAEFRAWRRRNAGLLAARAQHDGAHAGSRAVVLPGTCGVCLRPANFHATGGRTLDWRDQLQCDCASALPAHQRAMQQFVLGSIGVQPWYRIQVQGGAAGLVGALSAVACVLADEPPEASRQLLIGIETIAASASVPAGFRAAARALVPGGHFVFTCRLEPDLPACIFDPQGGHRIGWDVLDLLRDAGFHTATAHLYWSEEFAYLGAANFICVGIR